jgi:hypothetical protein
MIAVLLAAHAEAMRMFVNREMYGLTDEQAKRQYRRMKSLARAIRAMEAGR